MIIIIFYFFPAFLASVYFSHLKQKPFLSMELIILIPIFTFLLNLFVLGFLYIIGLSKLVIDYNNLSVSFLLNYGMLSLVSAIFLPNLFHILGILYSLLINKKLYKYSKEKMVK